MTETFNAMRYRVGKDFGRESKIHGRCKPGERSIADIVSERIGLSPSTLRLWRRWADLLDGMSKTDRNSLLELTSRKKKDQHAELIAAGTANDVTVPAIGIRYADQNGNALDPADAFARIKTNFETLPIRHKQLVLQMVMRDPEFTKWRATRAPRRTGARRKSKRDEVFLIVSEMYERCGELLQTFGPDCSSRWATEMNPESRSVVLGNIKSVIRRLKKFEWFLENKNEH